MTLEEIRDEVVAAGFRDFEDDPLVDLWVNRALREIENQQPWPWRIKQTTESGPAPYVIADLQQVFKIVCRGEVVQPEDYRNIVDRDPEMAQRGHPTWWYMLDDELYVWPATDRELLVTYLRRAQTLAGDSDEPEMPEEFHDLIVAGARIRGFRHIQAFEAAANERQEWQAGLAELVAAFQRRNYDSDITIQRTGAPAGY